MSYKYYQKDLNTILESEIFGIELFKQAAKVSQQPDRKQKWQTLQALEQQTLDRLHAFLEENNQTASSRFYIPLKGKVLGHVLGKLPWSISMYLLKDGTTPFMQAFERLLEHASPNTKLFFEYVLAHEESIYQFAQAELKKKKASSLASVELLLAKT